LFKTIYSTGAKGSTQTNQKNKLGLKRKEQKGNRRLPWSGAPDCPVCHRTVSGVPPDSVRCTRVLQLELLTFGFPRRNSAIIHRICPVHTGLSGAPAEQRLSARNGRLCKVNSGNQMSEQTVRGAPDCPVSHRTVSGVPPDSVRCTRVLQLELFTFGFPRRSSAIIHRTVRCTSGATTICAQRSTLQSEQ
jgi:hypothetical protein